MTNSMKRASNPLDTTKQKVGKNLSPHNHTHHL